MVIKHFTFDPNDAYLINARPGSPHPFFYTIGLDSPSPVACSNCISSFTSAARRGSSSVPVQDECLRAEAEARDEATKQMSNHHAVEEIDIALRSRATVTAFWRSLRRRTRLPSHLICTPDEEVHFGHIKRFSLCELQSATNNFSPENILRRGKSKVYKGCLPNGSLVTVKRLKPEHSELQFQTELLMVGLAVHPNLLKVNGFCITLTERLLVSPYMANGTVASHLKVEQGNSQPPFDWATRKKIALGTAKGLIYLHEQCNLKIIHCNVKAENITLDEDFEAVLGDFGLAKLMDCTDTHVARAIRGTFGHMPPEYLSMGVVSEKTDVFGYGVMLLEIISGKSASDLARLGYGENVMLLDWVKGLLRERKLELLVDSNIQGNHVEEEVEQLILVALLCMQVNATARPKMSEVVLMLEGEGFAGRWEEAEMKKEDMLHRTVQIDLQASPIPSKEVQFERIKRFSLHEVQLATDNFNSKNILGRDGFGKVYKGRLLDGSLVAVKRLREKHSLREELQFQTELLMVGLAVRRNNLKLHGFCVTPTERLLVYPYIPMDL